VIFTYFLYVLNAIFTDTFKLDFVEVLPDRLIMIEKSKLPGLEFAFYFYSKFLRFSFRNLRQKKTSEFSEAFF